MSNVVELLNSLTPDFRRIRKNRLEIYRQYQRNLRTLREDNEVEIITIYDERFNDLPLNFQDRIEEVNHKIKSEGHNTDYNNFYIRDQDAIDDIESDLEYIVKYLRDDITPYSKIIFNGIQILLLALILFGTTQGGNLILLFLREVL